MTRFFRTLDEGETPPDNARWVEGTYTDEAVQVVEIPGAVRCLTSSERVKLGDKLGEIEDVLRHIYAILYPSDKRKR